MGIANQRQDVLMTVSASSAHGMSSKKLKFPGEPGMFTDMYAQVREEEQVISLWFTRSQEDVSMRRRKKRKQVHDGTAIV